MDKSAYLAFCDSAVADEDVFRTFKSHPSYVLTQERVSAEQGLEYLNLILEGDGVLAGFLDQFRNNDRGGSPRVFEYGAFGRFSPATLRYVKVLSDLRDHFGDLNGKHIVEIGGGYGGQCKIITSFFNVASYTIYDFEPAARLIRKYLDKNDVRAAVRVLPFSELRSGAPRDLVISHFAFSECAEETREAYMDKIILGSSAGYLTCNTFDEPTRRCLADRIPGAKMVSEKPLTAPDNFVLLWGHRPIASVSAYGRNVTSQFGEDGIFEEIFLRIGSGDKWCVEFGAWDGKYASNTLNLWTTRGWSAVLIESEADRFRELVENTRDFPSVKPLHAFVTNEPGMLDGLLEPVVGDRKIDLMSIDIDGDEYHVFLALRKYLPRVLVIEYASSIPEQFHLIPAPGARIGASARAFYFLALQKGYTLTAITGHNMIFVQNEDFEKLGMERPSLKEIFPPAHLTYLMTPFDSVPFASRLPVFIGLDAKIYRKELPKFSDPHTWFPVHISHLHLAKTNERETLTPSGSKQKTVEEFGYLYLADRLVETGVSGERMAQGCKDKFREAVTAEPGTLEKILAGVSEPCVFWINNPFTPGMPDGARLDEIRKELRSILNHSIRPPIILIDHARLLNGEDGYPHIDRLEEEVRALRSDVAFNVREDILRIYPLHPPSLKQRFAHELRYNMRRDESKNSPRRWLKMKIFAKLVQWLEHR